MSCEYVRQYYKVPAEIGRRIVFRGKPGVIAADRGNYIGVNFDSDEPGIIHNVHPTDGVEYGEMGAVRIKKMTRSQVRYQKYRDGEYACSFADFLGIRPKREF